MPTSYDRLGPRSVVTLRVESLLDRYPDLNRQQLAELINLFPALSLIDRSLMTADHSLAEKLAAFHRDHAGRLKPPTIELIGFLAFPVIASIIALWWVLA